MPGNYVRVGVGVKDDASGPIDKIRGKFDTLGKSSSFKALTQGIGMGAGIAAYNLLGDAAGAAADFIGDSIDASRDLNETLSKSQVVFGDAAGDVEEFGDNAAKAMGMSKQAAIEAAATLGNFFTGIGQTKQAAADMSEEMVGLAGDLASFNNIDPGEALEKLRSGLAGEAEPLRALGVFLSEAKVKAKAMEMGLGDAHGELSEGEKILARYRIILDETKTAQGDFARTSEGLANSQRTANAELINAQAQLGESFEPIALGVTKAQIAVVDWFRQGVEGWQMLGGVIEGFGKKTEPVIDRTTDSVENLRSNAVSDLGRIGDATGDLKGDIRSLRQSAGSNLQMMQSYWDDMVQSIQDSVDSLQSDAFDPLEARLDKQQGHFAIVSAANARAEADSAEDIVDANADIINALDDQVDKLQELGEHGKLTKKDVDQFTDDVTASFKAMGKKVPPEVQKVLDKLRALAKYDGKTVKMTVKVKRQIGGPVPTDYGMAAGGVAEGGPTLVGEKGPEVVDLPAGAYVHPNSSKRTQQALGGTTNYNITVMGDIRARDKTELLQALQRLSHVTTPMTGYGVF